MEENGGQHAPKHHVRQCIAREERIIDAWRYRSSGKGVNMPRNILCIL